MVYITDYQRVDDILEDIIDYKYVQHKNADKTTYMLYDLLSKGDKYIKRKKQGKCFNYNLTKINMISQELTNKLKERRDDLCKFLDIKNKELIDLNYDKEISSPKFWDDSEKAEKVLKNKKQNKSWIEIYKDININIEELDVLIELEAKEEELINQYKKTL